MGKENMYHCRNPEYRGDMVGRPADDEIGESDFGSETNTNPENTPPGRQEERIHYTSPPSGEGRTLDKRKKPRFRVR